MVKIKATKEISSTNQSINIDLKYGYDNGGTLTQATTSDKVNISANSTGGSRPDSPVPNIIVSTYTYGGESVAAGSSFSLDFSFTNTGKLRIENIVVTVDGGESFTMDGSTNTFYYSSLAASASQDLKVPMQALPAAKTGAQTVSVSFKYEYVDVSKRASASADIKLSVPVFQKDRFQINAPAVPGEIYAGSEVALSLAYVNKGKSEVSNVEATIEGEGVDSPARTQYLGNIAAGASGTIGFALTPISSGDVKLTLRITYEDANQKLQTKEFPITLTATDMPVADDSEMVAEEPAPTHGSKWIWIAAAVIISGGALSALVIIRRKKNKAAVSDTADSDWDVWDDENTAPAEETTADGRKE